MPSNSPSRSDLSTCLKRLRLLPGRRACPRCRLPRATRVTSDANERNWSTILLMVSFNSRSSPRTSTVIFFARSPFATAVVTAAMLRTCEVRFDAIRFTFSVKSFQVPATPLTFAWPPSLPSVPTSRATRVTSDAKAPNCPTIAFTVLAVCKNSPFNGTAFDLGCHCLRQISLRNGPDDSRHLARRLNEIPNQIIDRIRLRPPRNWSLRRSRRAVQSALPCQPPARFVPVRASCARSSRSPH